MRTLLPLLALLVVPALAPAAGSVTLVRDGQACATIVVGTAPSDAATGAAAELAAYLQRMGGAEVPVGRDILDRPSAGPGSPHVRILVGQSAASDEARRLGLQLPTGLTAQFNDEGYLVYVVPGLVILAGNETEPYEGTWFAVYDFLERLGCRWIMPGAFGEVVPQLPTLTVPCQRRLVQPDLRVRDTWYSGHLASTAQQQNEFSTWKRRNRMSRTALWLHCLSEDAKYLQNPVDDSTWRLLPKEKYWNSHPEYYALKPGGTRNERFLCMSSPGAFEAAVATVNEWFDTHPTHHTFAFSPPDEAVLCNCPACTRAINGRFGGEGWGDISDPYFRFVFALADKVREQHPDRWITTMAYYNRCRPPQQGCGSPQGVTGKHPNVLMQLASIQQCSLHSYTQDDCWTRRQFAQELRQWGALTAGQVFYEYDPHDWTHLQRPCWRAQSEAEDLRLLKQVGGWGYSDEGQMAWLSTGLNYWVRARLAWDLRANPATLVHDACTHLFGPAAVPMERFYTSFEHAIRTTKSHSSGYPGRDDWQVILPRPLLDQCDGWLSHAAQLALAEPYRARVNAFRIYFDRMNAYVRAQEAMSRGDYAGAAGDYDRMVECVKRMNDTALLQDAGPWGGSRSGASLAKWARSLQPWTDGTKGKLVAMLPPVAQFRTDPGSDGVVGQWYLNPPKSGWRSLGMTSSWESQGVVTPAGRCYSGVAWYQAEVNVPAAGGVQAPALQSARLLCPEVLGNPVWVWCNGQFAGFTTKDSDNPLSVDLAGLLQPGRNRFTIRVQGEGGLVLPPFIFTPTDASNFADKRVEIPVLPAQWLFRLDPQQQGDREGWAKPDADESRWQAIPVPLAWEKTSVGDYDGVAWYRVRFTIPPTAAGKRLLLQFGAVDEEAWVYLNGAYQGENTEQSTGQTVHQIWDKPFTILLKSARPGAENVLVVKVRDSLGAGGIWMPVGLYQLP